MHLKINIALLVIMTFFGLVFVGNAQAAENCSDEYFIEQTMDNGSQWELCWEHRNREGIIYHDIYYTPKNGQRYKVLAEAAIAQIFVPYDDNGARYHDVSDYGLGDGHMQDLDSGDCPDGTLKSFAGKNVVCQQSITLEDAYVGTNEYRRSQALSVFSVSGIGSYNYMPTYLFYDDGTIEPSMGASGRLQRRGSNPDHGWLVSENTYGISHLHHYYWRLDFDLGDDATDDVIEEINFDGIGTRTHVTAEFSNEVARSLSPQTMRRWRVVDKGSTNASNEYRSYEINMQDSGHRDVGPSNEPWTFDDFYVTRTKTCEMYASHNPTIDGCANSVATFVNNESIANQDITVWIGITFHHVPRAEDEPRMHAHWNAMQLVPYNIHATTPSYEGSTTPTLTMSAIVDQNDEEGETTQLSLSASNPSGTPLTFSTNTLPAGLSLNPSTGVISGTLAANSAGSYLITATVSNGSQQTSQSFNWIVAPGNQTEICGDGIVDTGEQCDDGNTTDGDSCNANCQTEVCGNGVIDFNESCDDANIFSGDGCSAMCQVEIAGPSCGNGIIETGETCDDGNSLGGDGCSASCQSELVSACPNTLFPLIGMMWSADIQYVANSCSPNGNTCATYVGDPVNAHSTQVVCANDQWQVSNGTPIAVCGNGVLESPEVCDDGNLNNGDGCSANCQIEAPINTPPTINSTANQNSVAGSNITLTINASDSDGDTLSFSATGLPSGLSINTNTGLIGGTISSAAVGNSNVTVNVSDGTASANSSFIWSVSASSTITTVYSESFETNSGWVTNSSGTDTATTGMWQRAFPESTFYNGAGPYQPGSVTAGSFAMVTAGTAGANVGSFDIDNGYTSVTSPFISLPNANSITLDFDHYFSMRTNANADDFFRVYVVSGNVSHTIFESIGAAIEQVAVWQHVSRDLSAFANQTISLRVVAADGGQPSLIEAGIDAISITATDNAAVNPVCGNASVEVGEQCDDGNNLNGDGCSISCQIEFSGPSCGNGIIETGESCDDGNNSTGDGCSASCESETVSACPNTVFPLIGTMWSADIQYVANACSPNGNTCSTYVSEPINAHNIPIVCVENKWQVAD